MDKTILAALDTSCEETLQLGIQTEPLDDAQQLRLRAHLTTCIKCCATLKKAALAEDN